MKGLVISIAAVSLFLSGCLDNKDAQQAPQVVQMPPLPVEVQTVKYERVDFSKNYSALLKPFKEVNVVSRVSGMLEKEKFIEGSFVKEGDILYEIQKDEYKSALDEAKAELAKAEANYEKAARDYKRAEYLFEKSAISEQQRDELLYTYESSTAEVQRVKALVQNAQLDFGYATLRAPISGVAGMSNSDEGDYIDADTQNAKLVTITAQDPLYVEFSIPSEDMKNYMSQIKTGASVNVIWAGKTFTGSLDYIAPRVDESTDTLTLRAIFKNPHGELLPGSYAEAKLGGFVYEKAAKISQSALIKTPQATIVYVTKDGAVSIRPVNVISTENGIALIGSGLTEGETVIISNIAKIRPNTKVAIKGGN